MSDSELLVIEDPTAIYEHTLLLKDQRHSIGLVPTMGALHEGHRSLIKQSVMENDRTIVSIFVNPIQFDNPDDLSRYPVTFDQDRQMCIDHGVHAIYFPEKDKMYPPGFSTEIQIPSLDRVLCGAHRPGHFSGVATVVAKLFMQVPAQRAYFGLKDYQQSLIIRRLVSDLNIPIEIRCCPIVREPDGLALSSRNVHLSVDERQDALVLSQSIQLAKQEIQNGNQNLTQIRKQLIDLIESKKTATIDYVEFVDPDTLKQMERIDRSTLLALAVHVGKVRLIDNSILSPIE